MPSLRRILLLLAALSVLTACGLGSSAQKEEPAEIKYPLKFPMPSVPAVMSGERGMQYMAEHYWDAFLDTSRHFRCDSSLVGGVSKSDVETAVSNYVAGLKAMNLDEACAVVVKFADKLAACEMADSSSNAFEVVMELFERYVFDPNSPMRDEDIYASWAGRMSRSPLVSEGKRNTYADDALVYSLNRRGTKATDFSYVDKNGRRGSLYGTKATYTLIFFSNPGCHACKEIIDVLSAPGPVSQMVQTGRLAVINIYIDEDLGEWYKYMPIYPENWQNVYDDNYIIRGEELYNIRAIPSLYLLDADKTVLLKDSPPELLYRILGQIINENQ